MSIVKASIDALATAYFEQIVQLRRHFRRYPELGGNELLTQKKIIAELEVLGLKPVAVAGTGVIADLHGIKPGKTIALRADMDALPLNDEVAQPYRSTKPGVCHACGHDGHMAMLIGTAKVLAEIRTELAGTVRLLFQPSEENFPGGARPMIEAGALDGVDAILGAHLWQQLEVGQIGVTAGPMMAAAASFEIQICGRGGHSSMPHQAINPVVVGAEIVGALNAIVGCNQNPLETLALAVSVFQSGEAVNVIPDTAVIKGTFRCFSPAVQKGVAQRIETLCQGICLAHGTSSNLNVIFGYPAVINDPEVVNSVKAVGREILEEKSIVSIAPVLGSEDFSYYLEKVPGSFIFIGAGNSEKGICNPLHHPAFDMDETALLHGVKLMSCAALKLTGS